MSRDTSAAALSQIAPRSATLRELAMHEFHWSNLTADEVAARLGENVLAIRPRITELANAGKIQDSGTRRRNESGKSAIVWEAVAA